MSRKRGWAPATRIGAFAQWLAGPMLVIGIALLMAPGAAHMFGIQMPESIVLWILGWSVGTIFYCTAGLQFICWITEER